MKIYINSVLHWERIVQAMRAGWKADAVLANPPAGVERRRVSWLPDLLIGVEGGTA